MTDVMKIITIRPAGKDDYTRAEALLMQVQELHVRLRPDLYQPVSRILSPEEFTALADQQHILLAETEEQVAGLVWFSVRHIENPIQKTRNVLHLDAMVVDEPFRRQGIARQLLTHVKRMAEAGYDGFELQVNAANDAARKLYAEFGFTEKSINMELHG